jgi:transposase
MARAPEGIRAYGSIPFNPGKNITLTRGLSLDGVTVPMAVPGSTDGHYFLSYIKQVVVPVLRPGNVVLFDNLPAHKVVGVREAIEATGARLLLLPPYSPDLSPVENCGAKIKGAVRGDAPRTVHAVYEAIGHAIGQVTLSDARGWFTHSGYRLRPSRVPAGHGLPRLFALPPHIAPLVCASPPRPTRSVKTRGAIVLWFGLIHVLARGEDTR